MGIYWSAGLINAMFVELVGAFVGKYKLTVCVLNNIPYVIFPVAAMFR